MKLSRESVCVNRRCIFTQSAICVYFFNEKLYSYRQF